MAHFDPTVPHQMSYGTVYLTTSTGHPYTYHKGVAYFHCPVMNPFVHQWSVSICSCIQGYEFFWKELRKWRRLNIYAFFVLQPQPMLPQSHQPVHPQQPPVYHHYQGVNRLLINLKTPLHDIY